jgi:hypothetical protein
LSITANFGRYILGDKKDVGFWRTLNSLLSFNQIELVIFMRLQVRSRLISDDLLAILPCKHQQTDKTKSQATHHLKSWTFQDNTLDVSRNLRGQAMTNFALYKLQSL